MGKSTILSYSSEGFDDRRDAGTILGEALKRVCNSNAVIIGIPRGGVVVASEVARKLGAKLDIMLSRKIGAPGNPELAIGAIGEDGKVVLDRSLAERAGADNAYIEEETTRQQREITRRGEVFRRILPKEPLAGKVAVIVDDGLATGATMEALLLSARNEKPKKLIAAVPVGSSEAVERISGSADEVICARVPEFFAAVGQFYRSFAQTTDAEVAAILLEEAKKRLSRRPTPRP